MDYIVNCGSCGRNHATKEDFERHHPMAGAMPTLEGTANCIERDSNTRGSFMSCSNFMQAKTKPEGEAPSSRPIYGEGLVTRVIREIQEQREEILRAFVAKYDCDPARAVQILQTTPDGGMRWFIRARTDEEMAADSMMCAGL